ncbi:MAG: heme-binding protein [Burkholderiales bacterium]
MVPSLMKVICAGVIVACSQVGFAQEVRPILTQATAKKMADACEQMARAKGWRIVVAIVDTGGVLKQYSRMDDSFLISVDASQMKAHTSAGVPFSSRKFGEIAKVIPGLEMIPNTAMFAGGLPIVTAGGAHLGGIGVSGATADQDEECALAALDAVKDILK